MEIMARSPGESKIPVFHTNPLKSKISKPLATLSSRVRAHLDASSKSRGSASSVFFGIFGGGGGGGGCGGGTSGDLKNVNVNKSATISQFNSSSHDDHKQNFPVTRPTNIFISDNFFPSVVSEFSAVGVEHVGRRVRLNSGKEGVLRFVGKTQFGEGVWCGVELDAENGGSTDGSVNDVKYFSCAENRGVFSLPTNVNLISEEIREYISDVSDSGPHSLLGITSEMVDRSQYDAKDKLPMQATSENNYLVRKSESNFRFSAGCHFQHQQQQQISQLSTPTPNSSNDSYPALPCEWKYNSSQHSSSAGSLTLSHRGFPCGLDVSSSLHMSKHSSFECDESLGILTPDQMGELTTCSGDGSSILDDGGSCEDFSLTTFHHGNNNVDNSCRANFRSNFAERNMKYTSLDVPIGPANDENLPDGCCICLDGNSSTTSVNTELVDRIFSETDTCMMSVSSTSDQLEARDERFDLTIRAALSSFDDELSSTLIAIEQHNDDDDGRSAAVDIPAPSTTSFVTSVTSIGSWDNGYQGDGECSRPTSRGADASPPLTRTPKIITTEVLDPMTDSDFYTESDADLYDDVSCCLKGDRKARVIDGKLFGSPSSSTIMITTSQSYTSTKVISAAECQGIHHHERGGGGGVPSEEMDSSGIYSDVERNKNEGSEKAASILCTNTEADSTNQEEIFSDASGNSSLKSVSSLKLVICGEDNKSNNNLINNENEIAGKNEIVKNILISATEKTSVKNLLMNLRHQKQENGIKRKKEHNSFSPAKSKECSKSAESPVANKSKMARRNVTSKVETTTINDNSNKCSEDENQENHQPSISKNRNNNNIISKKRNGKWDSVMSKIEKGRNENKTKSEKQKDVKSKVLSMPRVPQSKLHKDVKPFSPNGSTINKVPFISKNLTIVLSGSTKSLKEISGHRSKTRKIRNRVIGLESPVQCSSVIEPKNLSQVSSRNSSVTDISDSHNDLSQHSLPAVIVSSEYSRGKKTSNLLCSPLSEGSAPIVPFQPTSSISKDVKLSTLPRSRVNLKQQLVGSVNSLIENSTTMKVPRKMTCRRTLPKVVPLKDQNNSNATSLCSTSKTVSLKPLSDEAPRQTEKCKFIKSKTKHAAAPISKINPLLARLKYATDGMEAFIILFQRLTSDMDVFALPQIKRQLSKTKSECFEMKLKLDEAQVSCRRLKEEIDNQKSLHELKLKEFREIHTEQLNVLTACHKHELIEHSENYEEKLKELGKRLNDQEKFLHSKFKQDLKIIQSQAEEKLKNILEETKNQVEVLRIENESWKRKLEGESRKNVEEMENKFKVQIEQMENGYINRLNNADEEVRKKDELFITFSKNLLKKQGSSNILYQDTDIQELNSEVGKLSLESLSSHSSRQEFQNLEEEICSLRTVLDLKHSEIQDLRKQNEKLSRGVQDLPFISQKLDSAQARVEDLNAQLQLKIENEKKLLTENRKLLDIVQSDSEKKKRLTFQNEELLWKLKKSAQVAKTLAVFRSNCKKKHVSDPESVQCYSTTKNQKYCHSEFDFNDARKNLIKRSRTVDDIEIFESSSDGDVSPKVLGVVEKNDSVSWVLEIDESPIAVASRMLRRANSLRGIPSRRKSNINQQSLTLPVRNKKHADSTVHSSTESSSTEFDITYRDKESDSVVTTDNSANRDKFEANVTSTSKTEKKSNAEDDESIILDIASFFEFLHESDFETDLTSTSEDTNLQTRLYSTDKDMTKSFSICSSSSDGSLELDIFGKEIESLSYSQFICSEESNSKCENEE